MRKIILFLLLLISVISFAQDLIKLRNGEYINCKITKVDSTIVYYDFYRAERKLSSFVAINDISSYNIDGRTDNHNNLMEESSVEGNTVIIDTTKYIKETNQWINLITYSQRFGIFAKGWSVQYYGYNLRNTSKWSIPVIFGIECFDIDPDYFYEFGYSAVNMSYFLAGISPFYKINDVIYLNLGLNLIYGEEELINYNGTGRSKVFFGLSPSQGIYFIPKSKIGITLGLSIYEKLLSSEVYNHDVGIKLEIGIKF